MGVLIASVLSSAADSENVAKVKSGVLWPEATLRIRSSKLGRCDTTATQSRWKSISTVTLTFTRSPAFVPG
jgi:hypothetical protein